MGFKAVFLSLILALGANSAPASSDSSSNALSVQDGSASDFWIGKIERKGSVAFREGGDDFKIFRNVKDYGAKGDGQTDDTDAINKAVSDGNRCGEGCPSSTVDPALVYFPSGTYVISTPIVQLYMTQFVGDAKNLPVLKASSTFEGRGVIDADPYYTGTGVNWWINQNNFMRQVRNFKIDLTEAPLNNASGIHWQVAQATSLQNIEFSMRTDGSEGGYQQGIFMDNGSGGFMSNLTFNGGYYGAFLGNQQFTTRNLKFNNCKTAIYMNWNWLWTLQDVEIDNCQIGVDMTHGEPVQKVGSVLLLDSKISNTPTGILTAYETSSTMTNGTLILDNVDMSSNVPNAVSGSESGGTILAGNSKISSWIQGRDYSSVGEGAAVQKDQDAVDKPDVLLNTDTGKVFTREKPQYEDVDASKFVSVKANGAKGDGKTDDTAAIQAVFDKATDGQIVYFDHGAYVVTDTIKVPKSIKMTGEVWPTIMAGGNSNFKDQSKPKPVFQVGQPGDSGAVEMSDMIFNTLGPQPGAKLIEWNVAGSSPGAAGMWDVHTMVGGSAGTQIDTSNCMKDPNNNNPIKDECFGAFMLVHITEKASGYFENNWYWVADHALEKADNNTQINVFNGRGVLIESAKGPVWMWGTAAEHSVLYNYQLNKASNVYMALIQTETPYFQGSPDATKPFDVHADLADPDFSKTCADGDSSCARAWGLRAVDSEAVFIYGAGLYSFFDNYGQTCVDAQDCQKNMVSLENSKVTSFGLTTKASVNMLTVDGKSVALDSDNRSVFGATLARFQTNDSQSHDDEDNGY